MQFLLFFAPVSWQRVLLILATSLCLSPALAQTAAVPAPNTAVTLARLPDGVSVSLNDVLAELQRAKPAERHSLLAKPEMVQQLANNLLVRRALAAEAQRDGLAREPVIAAALMVAHDRVLSDARLARLDAQNEPDAAALDAYARTLYQANSTKYERPAQTRARHILLDNKGPESLAKAKALLAQLRAGASFEELAKANSTDRGSAARGGDLGFFGAGKMVRPFQDALSALAKPGDLSEPVESQFGYHIIRLEERREKGLMPYEEVRSQLMAESRTALLNQARVQKAQTLAKDFVFEREAIEALGKPAKQ